jgi:hypothetical protein
MLHLDAATGNVDLWEYVDVKETLGMWSVFSEEIIVTL